MLKQIYLADVVTLSDCLASYQDIRSGGGLPLVKIGGARGVMVIVVGEWTRRHEFKSWIRLIAFHIALIPLGKVWMQLFSLQLWVNSHHHHIALVARISLTLSRHSSLSFIALGRSSGQHTVSSHSCWMYVRAGRPAFARPYVGVHKSTSLMSSSLLLQQCPACLVRLTWIVFVIGGRWPYSWCLVGCCCQDLFRIARSILQPWWGN